MPLFLYLCFMSDSVKFVRTTAINKLLKLKKRKRVIQGGTWAGKTFGIIPVLINKAASQVGKEITVVAETIPAVKKGAMADFIKIMEWTARWNPESWHATDRKYTFHNGSYIEFQAFDTVGKAKQAGKRTDLFINEAQYINYEIADTLITRTEEEIWIDFNPTYEFWAHKKILPDDDAEFCLIKYTDNEACPQTIIDDLNRKLKKAYYDPNGDRKDERNIKSKYYANWCKVYIDGEIGSLEGVVFENWEPVNEIPAGAQLLGAGMDFGFTNDPTTLIAAYKYNNSIYFDELIYRKGLMNSDIARLAKGFKAWIYADSAEPKSIADLKAYGLRIKGAEKGADSIRFGISLLQENKFYVTERSLNIINELRNYSWDKNSKGERLPKPIDAFNHAIDAMRYFAIEVLKKKNKSIKVKTRRRRT